MASKYFSRSVIEGVALAIILGVVALICYLFAVLQLCGKGFLLNNSYIYASEEERESMDKAPYYKQSGVIFCLIGTSFAANAAGVAFEKAWMFAVAMFFLGVSMVYAVVSTVIIEKRMKNK